MHNAKKHGAKKGHRSDNKARSTACCSHRRTVTKTAGKEVRSDAGEGDRRPGLSAGHTGTYLATHRGGRLLGRKRELPGVHTHIGALHRFTRHGRGRRRHPTHKPGPPGHDNTNTNQARHGSPPLNSKNRRRGSLETKPLGDVDQHRGQVRTLSRGPKHLGRNKSHQKRPLPPYRPFLVNERTATPSRWSPPLPSGPPWPPGRSDFRVCVADGFAGIFGHFGLSGHADRWPALSTPLGRHKAPVPAREQGPTSYSSAETLIRYHLLVYFIA